MKLQVNLLSAIIEIDGEFDLDDRDQYAEAKRRAGYELEQEAKSGLLVLREMVEDLEEIE